MSDTFISYKVFEILLHFFIFLKSQHPKIEKMNELMTVSLHLISCETQGHWNHHSRNARALCQTILNICTCMLFLLFEKSPVVNFLF